MGTIKVRIVELIDEIRVRVESEFGDFVSLWSGEQPELESITNVEIEITETLVWGETILSSSEKEYFIQSNPQISIVGMLVTIENDGYTIIRFGTSIICLITTGISPKIGSFVKLLPQTMELFEVEY